MYHELYDRFGRVVEIPGQERINSSARVRTYPVAGRHSRIWVLMVDAAMVDERFIAPVLTTSLAVANSTMLQRRG